MASDGETHPPEDEMLPDEREVLPKRAERLDELSEDELLTTDEVAANLGFDRE